MSYETEDLTATLVNPPSGAVELAQWAHAQALELATARGLQSEDLGDEDSNGLPVARMYIRPDGSTVTVDLSKWRDRPVHIEAARAISDPTAFAAYIDRHKTSATTIWATDDAVLAVLDDHEPARGIVVSVPPRDLPVALDERAPGDPGWARHRATLTLATAPEWRGWSNLHRVLVPQAQFAEVVEEFAGTLVSPDPETMLLVAQSITVASTGQVSSAISLKDGALNLTVTENLEANAGTRDTPLSIPTRITFDARRWLGVPATRMTARLRYRAERGGLKLGLVIDRLEDIEDTYRRNLATSIADATGCPVYLGRP